MKRVTVTVLGGGSWGTTVAALAARNAPTVLWARDPEVAREIDEQHTNTKYLGERPLPDDLRATADLGEALERADVVVFGVPSHSLRVVYDVAHNIAKEEEHEVDGRRRRLLVRVAHGPR